MALELKRHEEEQTLTKLIFDHPPPAVKTASVPQLNFSNQCFSENDLPVLVTLGCFMSILNSLTSSKCISQ